MENKRYLVSPRAALITANVAVIAVIAAIALRSDHVAAPPARRTDVAISTPPQAPNPMIDAGVPDADPAPVASVAPKVEGVKLKPALGATGVELQLDVAVALAGVANKKEDVRIKASCKLDGEWYGGSSYLWLSKLPAGTSVVQQKITLGTQHAFTALPSECQLGLEYTSYVARPIQRTQLATMCWDGATVSDKPCATKPTDNVAVSAVRVATSLDRYRSRRVGSPVDLEVSLDAQIKRPLDDWSLEVAADCMLPDGTTTHASERVWTRDIHAGRPFTSKAWLFRGAQQMADVPQSCTVAVQIADRQQLVREAVSAWCWRDGAVAAGACSA